MKRRLTLLFTQLIVQTLIYQNLGAQTGPGGVGNATGAGGQPQNRLWIRADQNVFQDAGVTACANLTTVQQWNDRSGNNNHVSQATAGRRPTFRTAILNGLPVVRFAGTHDLLTSGLNSTSALPFSFFAVTTNGAGNPMGLFDSRPGLPNVFRFFNAGPTPGANNSVELWDNNPAKGGLVLSTSGSLTTVQGSVDGSSNRQLRVLTNGSQLGSIETGNTNPVVFESACIGSINSGTNGFFNGDLAEMIYFNSSLNEAQRIIVENYLSQKYNLTLSSNDFYSNATFFRDVFGIGTKDGIEKHSAARSAGLELEEAAGSLDAPDEFLLAGHNNTTHSAAATGNLLHPTVIAANITSRWAREYYLEKTGSIDAQLVFDYAAAGLSRISNTPDDYYLLYRASTGITNFTIVPLSGAVDLSTPGKARFSVANSNLATGYYTLGLKNQPGPLTLYTFNAACTSGCAFSEAGSWTTDPTGITSLGSIVPRTMDNIVVRTGATVTTSSPIQVTAATIQNGGVLNLGINTSSTFSSLSGSGKLVLAASSGTLVYPTITTNNFLTTAGSTYEFSGSGSYNLPASPSTFRNVIFSGGGTKTVTNVLFINENLIIEPPTTFTTNSNLGLNGNFTNNGQFNQTGGTTMFSSNVAQTISGSPISTIFNNLTLNNSGTGTEGTITSTIDFTITGNFTSSTNNITAFNATAGVVILSSSAAQTIGGTGTGAVNFFNFYTSGAGIKTIGRNFSVTTTLITLPGSTLQFPAAGAARTVTTRNLTNRGTINCATPGTGYTHTLNISGSLNLFAATVFNMVNGTNVVNVVLNGTSQAIFGGTPTTVDFNNLTINAGNVVTLSDYNLNIRSNLFINGSLNLGIQTANRATAGGTISIGPSGTLRIGGTNTFPSNYTTVTLNTGSTVDYNGGVQNIRNLVYSNLTISGGANKSLIGGTNVNGNLFLNGATLLLGNFNFVFGPGSNWSGTPHAGNMIVANGSGAVHWYVDAPNNFSFPIGTGGAFSPLDFTLTTASFLSTPGTRFITIRPVATVAPSQLANLYSLTRHWITTSTNLAAIQADLTFSYPISDENSAVEPIYVPARWDGASWALGSVSEVETQSISYSLSALANLNFTWTAGPSVAFIPGTFYSFANGDYENASTWSLTGFSGPVSPIPPVAGSSIVIGNNRVVTATSGSKTVPTVTIDGAPNPGTLDIQNFTGFNFTTLQGSGKLRLFAGTGTAVFPTVTTNTFISTAGSTVEYYGNADYTIPAAPAAYQNFTLSGAGIKTLGGNITINENLNIEAGRLEVTSRNLTVLGATTLNGEFRDNNNAGTNQFTGALTIGSSGSLATGNSSPFIFQGGLICHGTFNQTANGNITFNTNNQTISGLGTITFTGTAIVSANIQVENQCANLALNGLTLNQNSRFWHSYSGIPTEYVASNNLRLVRGRMNRFQVSNHAGNLLTSTTGNNLNLTRNGAGHVFALRSSGYTPAAQAVVIQFDLAANSVGGALNNAASLLLGSGFSADETLNPAKARLRFNLGAAGQNWSITHPDGTPTTSGSFGSSQTVTWVINTSGAAVNYLSPNNAGAANSLANNRVDVWVGTTKFVNGLAMENPAQAINELKLCFLDGNGTFTINNLRVNPIARIQTAAIPVPCFKVTPYDGDSVYVNFDATALATAATHFNSGNIFTAQLSNASGSFAAPVTIGTLTSSSLTGTIAGMIPANTLSGSGYRIRVVSNNPLVNALDNGSNLIVNQFRISPAPPQTIIPSGTGSTLTATGVGVTGYQWGYYTILGGPITDIPGATASTYTPFGPHFPGAGTYSIVCRMTTSGSCGTNYSNNVVLYINCPPTANLVVNGDFSAGNTGFTSAYTYVVDDPAVQNEMWPEGTYTVINNPRNVHTNFCNMTTEAMRSPISGGNMLVGNAATTGSLDLWKQDIAVTPYTDYVMSFYASSLAGATNSLLFGIYTGCYRTGADVSVPFETFNCQWNRYTFQFNSGPNTTIPLAIRNISAQASGNDIAIDDIVVYACASVSSPPFVVANVPYWRGISSDWFNLDNWGTSCALPSCSDDVFIPLLPSGRVYPVINNNGANARSVEIRAGARLTINPGFNLNVCGNFDVWGSLTANSNSTVTFTGAMNPALVRGNVSGTNRLMNVVVNKANATDTVRLTGATDVLGNFTITQGHFKTGGHSMSLSGNFNTAAAGTYLPENGSLSLVGNSNTSVSITGTASFHTLTIQKTSATNTVTFNPASTLVSNRLNLNSGRAITTGTNQIFVSNPAPGSVAGHSVNSYVRGRLRRAVSGTGSYDYPVGDATRYQLINVNVTSALTPTASVLGYFNSATAPGTSPTLTEAGKYYEYVCQNGYWTLTPNVQPSSGLYDVTIYPDGFVCQGPYQTIAKRNDASSPWTFGGSSPVSFTSRSGFSSFSEFAQIDAEEPLPVNLLAFWARWKGQVVEVKWKSAAERDFSHYVIEKSVNGSEFMPIGHSKAGLENYTFLDPNPGSGKLLYRLKMVDLDQSFSYSKAVSLSKDEIGKVSALVVPNPSRQGQAIELQTQNFDEGKYKLLVVNLAGKEVFQTNVEIGAGGSRLKITDAVQLPKGLYMVKLHPLSGTSDSAFFSETLKLAIE